MDLVFWGIVLAVVVVMRFVARWVIQFLSEKENNSEFFQEQVGTDYKLEFPDKEWDQYVTIKKKIQEKLLGTDVEADEEDSWMTGLAEAEKKVLIMSLRNCMVRSICCLAQIQKDRPGAFRLWRTKLISENYWQSLQECEEETKNDIQDAIKEANRIIPANFNQQPGQPSFGDQFFDECVQIWRQQQAQKDQEEAKQRLVEQRQQLEKQKVQQEKVAEQKAAADIVRQEKERERIAQSLIMEEEIESKKSQKTRNRGSKKKNSKA